MPKSYHNGGKDDPIQCPTFRPASLHSLTVSKTCEQLCMKAWKSHKTNKENYVWYISFVPILFTWQVLREGNQNEYCKRNNRKHWNEEISDRNTERDYFEKLNIYISQKYYQLKCVK